MQLDKSMHGKSAWAVAQEMYRRHGVVAFWRGCVPPLWGSAVYRSVMMSSYELSYTFFESAVPDDSVWKRELLFVRPMVVASTVFCSLCRVLVEAPIEQAKVMRQLDQRVDARHLYRGMAMQTLRTTAMCVHAHTPAPTARRRPPALHALHAGRTQHPRPPQLPTRPPQNLSDTAAHHTHGHRASAGRAHAPASPGAEASAAAADGAARA
jgi:hypothetical protein